MTHRSGLNVTCTRLAVAATSIAAIVAITPVTAAAQRADTIVKMAGAPVHPGVATLAEELSIGVASGADEYMLGNVADVTVAANGTIYVLDRSIPGVRVYGADGKFIRTIGRRGQGPGEMLAPSGIAIAPDGRLLLWDTGNWRVNVYSAAGANLTQWTIPADGLGMSVHALAVDTAGGVYARHIAVAPPSAAAGPGPRPVSKRLWFHMRSSNGTIIDTILEPKWPREQPQVTASRSGSRSTNTQLVPFTTGHSMAISPLGYLVTGIGDQYAFELHPPNGGPPTSIRRDVKPNAVSDRERDEARATIEGRMRGTDPSWTWGSTRIPTTKPFYTDLTVGSDGRIWLTRAMQTTPRIAAIPAAGVGAGPNGPRSIARPSAQPTGEPQVAGLYDVFEPSGVFVGQVQIPPRVLPIVQRGDYVWALAFGQDDVPSVKRYRILWK